jgi:hypothetical protein
LDEADEDEEAETEEEELDREEEEAAAVEEAEEEEDAGATLLDVAALERLDAAAAAALDAALAALMPGFVAAPLPCRIADGAAQWQPRRNSLWDKTTGWERHELAEAASEWWNCCDTAVPLLAVPCSSSSVPSCVAGWCLPSCPTSPAQQRPAADQRTQPCADLLLSLPAHNAQEGATHDRNTKTPKTSWTANRLSVPGVGIRAWRATAWCAAFDRALVLFFQLL